jgi:hypothetical protein
MQSDRSSVSLLLLLLLAASPWSCRKPEPLIHPSVALLPSEVTLSCEGARRFVPLLSGGGTSPLSWKVIEPGGGTIGADGSYTAPISPGVFTIVASESGPQHAQGTARVRVVPKPDGTIRVPDYVRVGVRGLSAAVPSHEGNTYQWSISGGTLLPPLDGPSVMFDVGMSKHLILRCRVTNLAGDSIHTSMDIETSPEPQVKIRPDHIVISTGEAFKFGFDLSGRLDSPLLWKVVEQGGGTIDQTGEYVAPATSGYFHVETRLSPGKPGSLATVKVAERPQGRIEVQENLIAGTQNVQACVPDQVGMDYRWKVIGGSMVAGENISCIQFSVGPGPTLTLICLISNEAGASLELTRTLQVGPPDK